MFGWLNWQQIRFALKTLCVFAVLLPRPMEPNKDFPSFRSDLQVRSPFNSIYALETETFVAQGSQSLRFPASKPTAFSVSDLYHDGAVCESLKECNQKSKNGGMEQLTDLSTELASNELARTVKKETFARVSSAFSQQVALLKWFGHESPLEGPASKIALRELNKTCHRDHTTGGVNYSSITQKIIERAKKIKPHQALNLNFKSKSDEETRKEALLKRYIYAALEYQRIDMVRSDYAPTKKQKIALHKRKQLLRAHYPMVSKTKGLGLFKQFIDSKYRIRGGYSVDGHPKAEKYLFPDPDKGFAKIRTRKLANKKNKYRTTPRQHFLDLLQKKPIPEKVKEQFFQQMELSMASGIRSMAKLCKLDSCDTFNLDHTQLKNTLESRPKGIDTLAQRAVCKCDLKKPTEYIAGKYLLGGGVAALGTIGLCLVPAISWAACPAAAVIGYSLAGAGAVNALGDIKDMSRSYNASEIIQAMPDGRESERTRHLKDSTDAGKRLLKDGAYAAGGSIVGRVAIKGLSRVASGTFNKIRSRNVKDAIKEATPSPRDPLNTIKTNFRKRVVVPQSEKERYIELAFSSKYAGNRPKLYFDVENAVLKKLNDIDLKDQALVTVITKRYHELFLHAVSRRPGLQNHLVGKYRDYKSLRLAFQKESPEMYDQLESAYHEAGRRLESFLKKSKISDHLSTKGKLAHDPKEWFLGGTGASADDAALASRLTRSSPGEHITKLTDHQKNTWLKKQIHEIETLRKDVQDKISDLSPGSRALAPSGQEGKMVLSDEAVEILRKTEYKDIESYKNLVIGRFKHRLGVDLSEDPDMVLTLKKYYDRVDNLSPGIFEALDDAVNPVGGAAVTIDIGGAGATNGRILMKQMVKAADDAPEKALFYTREGAKKMMRTMDERRDVFQKALNRSKIKGNSGKVEVSQSHHTAVFSGDDGIAVGEINEIVLLKNLGKEKISPSRYRLVFTKANFEKSTEAIDPYVREHIAQVGQEMEKALRLNLEYSIPTDQLKKLGIAFKVKAKSNGKVLLKPILWGNKPNTKTGALVQEELEKLSEALGGKVEIEKVVEIY